ncbi:MAG: hypothetical protein IPL53_14980 [Ignavibacteria bacterium]|nr:hypothetical protein [Ignavibacteria bacterium]
MKAIIMKINHITECGHKIFLKSIINILVFILALTTCSCYSIYEGQYRPETIRTAVNYHVIKAIMKDGTIIELSNTGAVYAKKYKNKSDVIVYYPAGTNTSSGKTPEFIEIRNIKTLIMGVEEINTGLTILASIGAAGVLVLLVGGAIFASGFSGY